MDDVVVDMREADVTPPPKAVTKPPEAEPAPADAPSQEGAHFLPWDGRQTSEQINAFFARFPAVELRPRRGSDASASTSLYEHDPETFMAPIEDLEAQAPTEPPRPRQWRWEHTRRLRLMDSGLSNNLPNHVLARDERQADVIISFDASSDVKTGAAVERIHEFGRECGIHIQKRPPKEGEEPPAPSPTSEHDADTASMSPSDMERQWQSEADHIRRAYEPLYAQRFDGWRLRKDKSTDRAPDVHFVYCPLLPNAAQPGFDPTTAHYSTSYNLIWTADQVRALLRTAMANVEEGSRAVGVIREAVREAYESRKKTRLEREAQSASRRMARAEASKEAHGAQDPANASQHAMSAATDAQVQGAAPSLPIDGPGMLAPPVAG